MLNQRLRILYEKNDGLNETNGEFQIVGLSDILKGMDMPAPRVISHQPYFENLGELDETDPMWCPILAGLLVLRIVDAEASDAYSHSLMRQKEIEAARTVVSAIPEGDPSRAILLRIAARLEMPSPLNVELARGLLAYGRSLDLDARWALASDVFRTVAEHFRSLPVADLVIESLIARGAAARNLGDWETSIRSYAEAQHIADSAGALSLSLKTQVGFANSYVSQGNLSAARAELDEVLADASRHRLQDIEAIALHTLAYLCITSHDYQRAVHYGYRSLELTTDNTARDRVLADIAAAYAGLGMRETARDAYSIVAVTSPHQWVRWQATLNLMELSIDDSDEKRFDRYVAEVDTEQLDPRLRAYCLLLKARGFRKFARKEAESVFAAAGNEARKHGLHQMRFEIENEAEQIAAPTPASQAMTQESPMEREELERVAKVLMHLREELVVG